MIDFKNERQVKDFMLETLIKKEWLQDQVEKLNEEVKCEKETKDMWFDRYIETLKEKTLLKEELDEIKKSTKAELENMNQ